MWSDKETDVDLLGFDVLVDELAVALTDGRLLPLTVGVLGGWGSGKSSLLKQAYRELATEDGSSPYVCVEFSPWKYEDYDDVKSAFMRLVLDACATRPVVMPIVSRRSARCAGSLGASVDVVVR